MFGADKGPKSHWFITSRASLRTISVVFGGKVGGACANDAPPFRTCEPTRSTTLITRSFDIDNELSAGLCWLWIISSPECTSSDFVLNCDVFVSILSFAYEISEVRQMDCVSSVSACEATTATWCDESRGMSQSLIACDSCDFATVELSSPDFRHTCCSVITEVHLCHTRDSTCRMRMSNLRRLCVVVHSMINKTAGTWYHVTTA